MVRGGAGCVLEIPAVGRFHFQLELVLGVVHI